ncbi:MAG TPA: hypothetical protein VGJ26_09815 [Pirellulales bacterium]
MNASLARQLRKGTLDGQSVERPAPLFSADGKTGSASKGSAGPCGYGKSIFQVNSLVDSAPSQDDLPIRIHQAERSFPSCTPYFARRQPLL